MDIIKQNIQEIIDEEQLQKLYKTNSIKVYWGTAITGKPHFGYLVPFLKIKDLVEVGANVTILFADIHGLLDKTEEKALKTRLNYYKTIITTVLNKLGVDLSKIKFVVGSDYQLSKDYMFDLLKVCSTTKINDAKHAGSEVTKQDKNPLLGSLVYPIMQMLDEKYLGCNVQLGGIDQRKIFAFSRTNIELVDYTKSSYIMNPLIPGLTKEGKMSSSVPGSKIDFDDSDESITEKIKKAYCVDGVVENNGIMAMIKYILFPLYGSINFEREIKYGGDLMCFDYEHFEKLYVDNKICSADIKPTVSKLLIKFIQDIRHIALNTKFC